MIQVMERIASFLEEKDLYSLLPKIKADLGSFPLFSQSFQTFSPFGKAFTSLFPKETGLKIYKHALGVHTCLLLLKMQALIRQDEDKIHICRRMSRSALTIFNFKSTPEKKNNINFFNPRPELGQISKI